MLRLAVGWHFYKEGVEKQLHPDRFSSAPFLLQAKGPLAPLYHANAPDFHQFRKLLAAPARHVPLTPQQEIEVNNWAADYAGRIKEAEDANKPPPAVEFPPYAPYKTWAEQIADDWRGSVVAVIKSVPLDDQQQQAIADLLDARLNQLRDYFAEVDPLAGVDRPAEIAKFRNELWRLEKMQNDPTAGEMPYQGQRIATKSAETQTSGTEWLDDVQAMENQFYADIVAAVDEDQRPPVSQVLGLGRQQTIDTVVTYLVLGVGVLLVLGLFTRIAAVGGALFTAAVIASQPPWAAGATPNWNTVIEFAALLVLAFSGAGRWAGLDFFVGALCGKCCKSRCKSSKSS